MHRSSLWERIDAEGVRDVSIVGISKHAGKTTVLGRLIADAADERRRLGIASIGLDGERADSLLGIPKPAICVPGGTFFATAMKVHRHDHAATRWMEPAGISSPLGEVWIGETREDGPIELAGVRQLAHLRSLRLRFHELGADHVLFDGALSRMISVSPQAADGVMLAAGAAVGTLEQVVRETFDAVRKLTMPLVPDDVGVWLASQCSASGVVEVPQEVFTARENREAQIKGRMLFEPGAITDSTLSTWIGVGQPIQLVVRDPTCLFVTAEGWRAFLRAGHQLLVLSRLPLIGVAVNPSSPFGEAMDRHALLRTLKAKLTVPVWDVMDRETTNAMDG